MNGPLLQIGPTEDANYLSEETKKQLQAVYSRVPGVSCHCDKLGQCCELTPEEMAADFATMYPLYAIEYLNIVDYVRAHFDSERQAALLGVTDERPERCPFLTETGGCSIYPVRPLVCRTYGVLRREEVEETAKEARGQLSAQWISSFLFTERHTVCPHTQVLEPAKVAEHAQHMITFDYERELLEMGRAAALDGKRKDILRSTAGLERITRWTWGGFNVLMRAPLVWLKDHFAAYWRSTMLGE